MPLLMSLLGGLLSICSSMVGRVLLALGLGYVTYSGFNVTIDWLLAQIKTNIGAMGADTISFLGFMWVDKAIGLVFSAYAAAILVKLAGSTSLKKLVQKG